MLILHNLPKKMSLQGTAIKAAFQRELFASADPPILTQTRSVSSKRTRRNFHNSHNEPVPLNQTAFTQLLESLRKVDEMYMAPKLGFSQNYKYYMVIKYI